MTGFRLLDRTADALPPAMRWRGWRGAYVQRHRGVEQRGVPGLYFREVSIGSTDVAALAVDWPNELLYVFDAEGFLRARFRVSVAESGISLVARCAGEPVDLERHEFQTAVKVATYHDLDVSQNVARL